jgi:hypothetical protein
MIEYEKQPTVSWLYGIISVLKSFLTNYNCPEEEVTDLCRILVEKLDSYFNYVFTDPVFLIAAYVDPATNNQLKSSECAEALETLISWVSDSQ